MSANEEPDGETWGDAIHASIISGMSSEERLRYLMDHVKEAPVHKEEDDGKGQGKS